MENYAVGTQFKATEPVSFSILYNNHPNYPLKNDWLFWSELKSRTNVTLEPVAVPLSDYEQKRSLLDRRRRRAVAHPEDLPEPGGSVRLVRSDPAGQRLPRSDAELQGQDREVEPEAGDRHPAAGGRQVLPAARHPREALARLLAGGPHRHPGRAEPGDPEDLGRPLHRAQGDEGEVPERLPVLRSVEPAQPGWQPAQPAGLLVRVAGGRVELPARQLERAGAEVRVHRRHRAVQADAAVPQQARHREAARPGELHPDRRPRPAEARQQQVLRDRHQRADPGERVPAGPGEPPTRRRRSSRFRCRSARPARSTRPTASRTA